MIGIIILGITIIVLNFFIMFVMTLAMLRIKQDIRNIISL